ncbi:hypothetical protein [Pedobacter sp. ASV12]|nr:hypothetical protein [Pedobacter sp. ASV12]
MSKEKKNKPPKTRADKYEEKVSFEGTLEQMIEIAVKTNPKKETK